MALALTLEEVEGFERDGFVRLEAAFPPEVAERCRARLWRELGLDLERPSEWTRPVIRLIAGAEPPYSEACDTRRLRSAWDSLVGAGRWRPRSGLGNVAIRFPSEVDPGDAGWHVDGSFAVDGALHLNLHSHARALLMLFLLSDVSELDAPTRIRVGSHRRVPAVLRDAGPEGLAFERVVPRLRGLDDLPIALATGRAGDVLLCHPFLVHAASWPHRGRTPRFLAQPGLDPAEPLRLERVDGAYSAVERAIRAGLVPPYS